VLIPASWLSGMVEPYASIGRCSTSAGDARPVRITDRFWRSASIDFFILPSASRKTSLIIAALLNQANTVAMNCATCQLMVNYSSRCMGLGYDEKPIPGTVESAD